MPPATTTSESPAAIAWAASITAFRPEPQTLLIVRAATLGGRPAPRAAWRAGACPRPAVTTVPRLTSSTASGGDAAEPGHDLRLHPVKSLSPSRVGYPDAERSAFEGEHLGTPGQLGTDGEGPGALDQGQPPRRLGPEDARCQPLSRPIEAHRPRTPAP